ncbi:MAG: 3-deoxy-D-manno-octulosonic acid transferase, partial [Pyrinomonadaceae bacterium]
AIETKGRPVIWLHCVSVGETQAARPLVNELVQKFPTHALVVSTVTLTGQSLAREVFSDKAAAIIYFPLDWAWTVRRALSRVKPSAVLIMETELWPRFLRECRKRKVPVAIVNGRLSEKSFRNYKLIRSFISSILNNLDLALMQTEADAGRIRSLGLAPDRVVVSGNIKFDSGVAIEQQTLTEEIRERFKLEDARPLIVAASTHAPEERITLEAFKQLRASLPTPPRLLLAPRHPERFAEAATLLDSTGLRWARRSNPYDETDRDCDVILLDSIGELRAVYPLAKIVFVGGSIARTGGHNILEPAAAGACIITGAHTFNFTAIISAFQEADALVQLSALTESEATHALAEAFLDLLRNAERRKALAANARAVCERNRGATARTIKLLAPLLSETQERGALLQARGARPDALSA